MKTCDHCHVPKPEREFYRWRNGRLGRCIPCTSGVPIIDPPERATRTPRPPIVVRRLTTMQMLWVQRREARA